MNNQEDHACPICVAIPPGKIFQCKEGHPVCESCLTRIQQEAAGRANKKPKCPFCTSPLDNGSVSRNRALENILDGLTFNCQNAGAGCRRNLKRNEILSHVTACIFEVRGPLDICKILGYSDCDLQLLASNADEVMQHLIDVHSCKTFDDCLSWHWNLEDFSKFASNQNNISTWKCLFRQSQSRKNVLIVCETENNYASWSCVDLSPTGSAPEEVVVTLSIPNEEVASLTWTSTVVSSIGSWSFLKNPQFKTSIPYMLHLCNENGSLGMDVKIRFI